ncbi:MAG: Flp pilus assembly complex ATPase component TadA [Verrucomicrobia bacterium]|nr:Flp pilus assembly complex ATPase component TadA [Verrucomicrobiota bacterium]MBU4292040.1 Flp pilus assembly complex ATPase component TadA [Verrucomicrobiota bacterium]MBU4427928.1 Flp pilus assembly complex ATPase component TadA [Verrucomicrobiota bacterium]MCG2678874.1 Flp pilus assembly complex ATPase component TadA [Kiritimatiellia bacterium]
MTGNDDYIIEILKDVGLIKAEQIEEARSQAGADKSVVDVLVETGVISKMEVLKTVAMQLGMDVIVLADQEIPPEVIKQVPAAIARRYKVVPVFSNDNTLTVALADPLDIETLDSLRYILKRNVEGVVASDEEISIALDHHYGRVEKSIEELLGQKETGNISVNMGNLSDESETTDSDAPIIKLVSLIILEAQRNRASDIHLEPMEKRFRIRYRIDGDLREVENPPKRLQSSIISRLKLMSGMKIAEKRVPQDGRIQINVGGEDLDLRVSTVPATHGESMVMRILSKQNLGLGLPKLGFFADDQQVFEKLIGLPDGILLMTGPTGSGKTTTLYAILNHLNRPDCKIITVEDPVEYQLSGINQVQVREDIGLTFPAVLRSILRQAPNIIMVGEIRDFDTAEIAINAALTGHLVFSTLHTNDAPSAITRLLDIGVKPFLLASSIRATIAQRLVKVICEKCKETYTPSEQELLPLGPDAAQLTKAPLYRGKGCNACSQVGFKGRKGIFEVFIINDDVREMIFRKVASDELRRRAREMGMRTLREDGLRKVVSGMTTLSEVLSITMGD